MNYDINYLSIFPFIISISNTTLHTPATGNMLGNGSISLSKNNKGSSPTPTK